MVQNLKILREGRNISQKSLAEAVGVSQQSINKYENHNIEPDIETLCRLADYFNTSVDYVIGHTEERRKVEPVRYFDLNDEEARLVTLYRQLDSKWRRSMETIAELFSETIR